MARVGPKPSVTVSLHNNPAPVQTPVPVYPDTTNLPNAVKVIPSSGAALVLTPNLTGAAAYDVTLTAPTVAITFAGWLPGLRQTIVVWLRQDATAGRAFTLPGAVKWTNGAALVPVTTAGTIIELTLTSLDGGTTILAK